MSRMRLLAAGAALLTAAALCGCSSTAPTAQQTTAAGTADTAAADTAVQTTAAQEAAEEETTMPPAPEAAEEETLPAPEEELPETYAPGDNNGVYAWFRRGVYATDAGNWYVFYDEYSGKVVNADGMGVPFSCEQTRGYIDFHMGADDQSDILYISVDDDLRIVGTWEDGSSLTFTDEEQDPDQFDPGV